MPGTVKTTRLRKCECPECGYVARISRSWLEAFVDEDGDLTRIVYHFNDWYDHAERTLEGSEFDAAESFVVALIPEL